MWIYLTDEDTHEQVSNEDARSSQQMWIYLTEEDTHEQ